MNLHTLHRRNINDHIKNNHYIVNFIVGAHLARDCSASNTKLRMQNKYSFC